MKTIYARALSVGVFCSVLALAACNSSVNSSSGGSSAPTVTPTQKAPPTAVPTLSAATCQRLLSLAEANQYMSPPTPATTIKVDAGGAGGGTCGYDYAPLQAIVVVTFEPYKLGAGHEQAILEANAQQLQQNSDQFTSAPISGLGTAALFEGAIAGPIKEAVVNVVYGAVFISCANFKVGSASFDVQKTALTQVCKTVVSRM
jgi:hypothetical protein